jgi:two-component system cell cycle sensor histidine kinase/response regulator CckA
MQTENKGIEERQFVVLIADDDVLCLDVGVKMLQKLGYRVLDARDGKEAIEVFKNNQGEVDLVILDMKMPHNGANTFERLKELNSDVKVLIASGFTEDQRITEMKAQGCYGFLQKPFSIKSLSEQVTNALNN